MAQPDIREGLQGFVKNIYTKCEEINTILELVKKRQPYFESIKKLFNQIQSTFLSNIAKQTKMASISKEKLSQVDSTLAMLKTLIDDQDLKVLNEFNPEKSDLRAIFEEMLGEVESGYLKICKEIGIITNFPKFNDIWNESQAFEAKLVKDKEKSKFFSFFRCTEAAKFWFNSFGNVTDELELDEFLAAFSRYMYKKEQAVLTKAILDNIVGVIDSDFTKTISTREVDNFFRKYLTDYYQKKLILESPELFNAIPNKAENIKPLRKQVSKEENVKGLSLSLEYVDPNIVDNPWPKGTVFVIDKTGISFIINNKNTLLNKNYNEEAIVLGRLSKDFKPDICFPPTADKISRKQLKIILRDNEKLNGRFHVMDLASNNATRLIVDPARPYLLSQNMLGEIYGGFYFHIVEVIPQPGFYPEKKDRVLFKLDTQDYQVEYEKAKIDFDQHLIMQPKKNKSQIRGVSDAAENNKAWIKFRLFEKNYQGFTNFRDFEKSCEITKSAEFSVGSAKTADFIIDNEDFVSKFQFDIHFEPEIGWYIKPREQNTGTFLHLKNFTEFLESQVKNICSRPHQLRVGMKLEFAGNVLKVV